MLIFFIRGHFPKWCNNMKSDEAKVIERRMFCQKKSDPFEFDGKSDSVDWRRSSGCQSDFPPTENSSDLALHPFVTWSPSHGTGSDWKFSGGFVQIYFWGLIGINFFVFFWRGVWWDDKAALPTPAPPSISWPGNHACLTSPPPLLLHSPASPLLDPQQRGTIHHFKQNCSDQAQAHGQILSPTRAQAVG